MDLQIQVGKERVGQVRRVALIDTLPCAKWASLAAQTVKNLPTMRETQARSLGQEDH